MAYLEIKPPNTKSLMNDHCNMREKATPSRKGKFIFWKNPETNTTKCSDKFSNLLEKGMTDTFETNFGPILEMGTKENTGILKYKKDNLFATYDPLDIKNSRTLIVTRLD